MPLDKSGSKASIGNNIRIERAAGKKQSQAVAIALDVARRAKKGMASGGNPTQQPWFVRHAAETMMRGPRTTVPSIPALKINPNPAGSTPVAQAVKSMPKVSAGKPSFPKLPNPPKLPKMTMKDGGKVIPPGPLLDHTPGRADKINGQVEDGSYILPSDCVSACGENSSLAGHAFIEHMIAKLPKVKSKTKAMGGAEHSNKPVSVALSGGEHVLSRETVERIGGGDYEKGRRILDHFVMHIRHKNIESLKKLPPPAE